MKTVRPTTCREAAITTYLELRACGETDPIAFDAAVQVYRCRHPEMAAEPARIRVADWIDDALSGTPAA
ncbi:MAG: hypothetical protein RIE22_07270 [Alphaproteobacteria bacterium]